jgi:GNAT superfamily N-acetyltransferase
MEYVYKRVVPIIEKLEEYSTFLSLVFSKESKFTASFLKWQYCDNPFGTVVGYDAYFEDKLVAHYVTIPVQYYIFGVLTKGLLSLNTAVHPSHQGKGLFTKLANKTYDEAIKLGYEFIIGVANQNSTPGFVNKLGFQLISPLDVKIGIGKMFNNPINLFKLSPIRNEAFVKWRLLNPSKTYLSSNHEVYVEVKKNWLHAQLISLPNSQNFPVKLTTVKPIFKLLIGKGIAQKNGGLYFDLPSIFKPSPLNLIFKDLTGKISITGKDDVFFELIDFDAY